MEAAMMAADAGSDAGGISHGSETPASTTVEGHDGPSAHSFKGTKHKVKIDGAEREVDYDDLLRDYQTREAAHKRWREANELETKRKQREELAKKDPAAYLKELGHDPEEFATELLLKKIEWQEMTAEQREAVVAKRERDELKRQLEEKTALERKEALETAQSEALAEIDTDIAEALKSAGQKPTPRLVARLAETMLAHLEGGKQVKATEVYGNVRQEYLADIVEFLTEMPVEEARKLLPKKFLDGLRRANVDETLSRQPIPGTRRDRPAEAPRKPEKATTTDDFFSKLEKRFA